jgi:tRNA pseudouridine55 synthase
VLPLAVGTATRLIEFASYPKEYRTTCLLGKTTDSCDITGKLLEEKPTTDLSPERVREEVLKLADITQQEPPMVSALKTGGRKLYELARKGIVVERKARPVQIEQVEILALQIPRVSFRVVCSAGTYVRVLCQTLGESLGVGGCMESLERTQVGPFLLKDSVTLEELAKKAEGEGLPALLFPSSLLAERLPQVELEGTTLEELCLGKTVLVSELPKGLYRVKNKEGLLSAIAEVQEAGGLKPKKVFGKEGIL